MIHGTIFGRVGKDPETRALNNGNSVVSFSIAADHGWGDKKTTTWVQVAVFGNRGKVVQDRVAKGQRLVVHGEIYEEEWTDRDGNARKTLKCNADQVEIVDWGDEKQSAATGAGRSNRPKPAAHPDDDLPF